MDPRYGRLPDDEEIEKFVTMTLLTEAASSGIGYRHGELSHRRHQQLVDINRKAGITRDDSGSFESVQFWVLFN